MRNRPITQKELHRQIHEYTMAHLQESLLWDQPDDVLEKIKESVKNGPYNQNTIIEIEAIQRLRAAG